MKVTADSIAGRRLTAAKGTADVAPLRQGLTAAQEQWNAEWSAYLESRKKAREARKAQKHG